MRYRTINPKIWIDKKFSSLSPTLPSAQSLFIYLLTNPFTSSIPGLYRAGKDAMAEELGWNVRAFNNAFIELVDAKLVKADFNNRVIFIPNAFKYNKPRSLNVIKGWRHIWAEIPECELKEQARIHLAEKTKEMGPLFYEAFIESCKS